MKKTLTLAIIVILLLLGYFAWKYYGSSAKETHQNEITNTSASNTESIKPKKEPVGGRQRSQSPIKTSAQ